MWLIKIFKVSTFWSILDQKFINPILRKNREKRIEKVCQDDLKANDILSDHTKMGRFIYVVNGMKLAKLFLLILIFAYFTGMYWYIIIDYIGNPLYPNRSDETSNPLFSEYPSKDINFINVYDIEHKHDLNDEGNIDIILVNVYFSLTTLTTVGFGDKRPTNGFEALLCVIILFCGYITFSLLQGQLHDMISILDSIDNDFEDSVSLQKFIGQLRRFNNGMKLKDDIEDNIKDFFHYKWENDKNIFLLTEKEQMIMEQLPRDVQVEIFQKFLYKDFLMQFRRFFRFRV